MTKSSPETPETPETKEAAYKEYVQSCHCDHVRLLTDDILRMAFFAGWLAAQGFQFQKVDEDSPNPPSINPYAYEEWKSHKNEIY